MLTLKRRPRVYIQEFTESHHASANASEGIEIYEIYEIFIWLFSFHSPTIGPQFYLTDGNISEKFRVFFPQLASRPEDGVSADGRGNEPRPRQKSPPSRSSSRVDIRGGDL